MMAEGSSSARGPRGGVAGQATAARTGLDVLEAGGNAADAAVAAALVAAVVSIHNCGIGGYGGHMVIALPGGSRVTAIDFNSTAPAAARPDMFPLDANGRVPGRTNVHGWLAAGVPGTLAGLQLALDRYGSRPLREIAEPAIRYARDGFVVGKPVVTVTRAALARLRQDPGTARLLLVNGEPPPEGSTLRNPALAAMLQTLVARGSVDSFYRGDIGQQIADAFCKNGGLVSAEDMAAYQAREVEPIALQWGRYSVMTAPLTAGGATVLEGLSILHALGWDRLPLDAPSTTHARLDTMRVAWDDRLKWLGDPDHVQVPLQRLLSPSHAAERAEQVRAAVRERRPAPASSDGGAAAGTINLSASDDRGMMVALTLTHGGGFGAQVAVEELGLVLGHGIARFDPRPGHPNSIGPGKKPLHNMCPTIVLRDGVPVLAIGAAGGRKIPNSVFDVLAHYVGRGMPLAEALAAPRLHSEGGLEVSVDPRAPEEVVKYLEPIGYKIRRQGGANVSAASYDPVSGAVSASSEVLPAV